MVARGSKNGPTTRLQRTAPSGSQMIGIGVGDHHGLNMIKVDVGGVGFQTSGERSRADSQVDTNVGRTWVVVSLDGQDGQVAGGSAGDHSKIGRNHRRWRTEVVHGESVA